MAKQLNQFQELIDAVAKDFLEYRDEVEEIAKEESKKALKELKRAYNYRKYDKHGKLYPYHNPSSKAQRKSKYDYGGGWKLTTRVIAGYTVNTIHNPKKYNLVHLLEHGYINKKTGKRTKPNIHVAPVEDALIHEIERRLDML